MGDVIDFVQYRESLKSNLAEANLREGVSIQTYPPFIIFKHYKAGMVHSECRLISEHMLREMLENMP